MSSSTAAFKRHRINRLVVLRRRINVYANTRRGLFPFIVRKLRVLLRKLSELDIRPHFSDKICTVFKSLEETCGKIEYSVSQKLGEISDAPRKRLHAVILLACVTVGICSATMLSFGLKVSIKGKYVGCVESINDINQIIAEAERHISDYTGRPYNLNLPVTYSLSLFRKSDIINSDAVEQIILSSVDYLDSGNSYKLYVGDSAIGSCDSFEVLNMALFRIACQQSGTNGDSKLSFTENVVIKSEDASQNRSSNISEITNKLLQNKSGEVTYTVASGDTLSGIAVSHGLSVSDLKALNPSINIDNIKIGQTITIANEVPYIQTKNVVQKAYVEDVPYETKIEYTSSLYTNQTQIQRAGKVGKANVLADIDYINGVEAGRTILSYEIYEQPVDQIKLVGTKALPPKAATGKFQSPVSGRLTSTFGYRPSFRDNHTGIDIANSTGTTIKAADGGTVTLAARNGNYGLCVIIDHGNGYTTLYAHNSGLLVKAGQKVAKGEAIAKMGMTGRATGPHCHFEIRYKGVAKNPLNYIKLY